MCGRGETIGGRPAGALKALEAVEAGFGERRMHVAERGGPAALLARLQVSGEGLSDEEAAARLAQTWGQVRR